MPEFEYCLAALRFSGSETPTELDADVTILVGPNNGGKSRALREIRDFLASGNDVGAVVSEIKVKKSGDADAVAQWLETVTRPALDSTPGQEFLQGVGGARLQRSFIPNLWSQHPVPVHFAQFLVGLINTEERLTLTVSQPNIDVLLEPATAPMQVLLREPRLEQEVSDVVQKAFGEPISVTRIAGTQIHLLLGRATVRAVADDPEYLDQVRQLPRVHDQGDGVRSFIGLMLAVLASRYRVLLVDEPEAFLHPPQAREIGRQLASAARKQSSDSADQAPADRSPGAQVVLATHSTDVLLGALDSERSMTVIRVQRQGDTNSAHVLANERLRELWSDPVLRYSNLLDGLFARGVVLCEAEGDARLYAAALDAGSEASGTSSRDVIFSTTGGKDGLFKAARILTSLSVPVAAIADLDVLREESKLKKLVESLGGVWSADMSSDFRTLLSGVSQLPSSAPVVRDVATEIQNALGEDMTARLSEEQTRRIRDITKSSDGWKLLKSAGISAVPNGEATSAAGRLLVALAAAGLFVVQIGELEQWAPEIGIHGPAFANAALAAGAHKTNSDLQAFTRKVADYLFS